MWDNIKQEVILLSQIEYLNKIDIFKVNFIFSSHILPYLKMQKFKENEMIYRKEDSSEEIFFLTSGEVCLIDSNNDIMLKIRQGSMFGEVEVIDKQNRRDFCKCITDCVILVIDKEIFLKEMDKFENLKDEIVEICKTKRKLIDDARNKIVMKRLQLKLQREGGQSNKDQEKRDSLFEEQSGIEFYMQKKKLPNSSRHYFLFLKAYNKYREKLTKKKTNIVYSEMFEEDVEQKSDSEGNDEIFEADQEEYDDEQEEVDSDAYRKMYTSKLSRKKLTLNGKSSDNMFEEFQNQLQRNSQRTIKIPPEKKPTQKEEVNPNEFNENGTYQNSKSIQTNMVKQDTQVIQEKDEVINNKGKVKFVNDQKSEQSRESSDSKESSESKESSDSEDVDDFNNAYDQYQTQENNTNILQAKLKKIKNNVQIIQRLKQQYDLLVREVNIKKNALIDFNQRHSKDTNKQDCK